MLPAHQIEISKLQARIQFLERRLTEREDTITHLADENARLRAPDPVDDNAATVLRK